MKKVKVFSGCWQGVERRVVATTTLAKACQLTGITRNFLSETGNELEVKVALRELEVPFGYCTREVRLAKDPSQFVLIDDHKRPIRFQLAYKGLGND